MESLGKWIKKEREENDKLPKKDRLSQAEVIRKAREKFLNSKN